MITQEVERLVVGMGALMSELNLPFVRCQTMNHFHSSTFGGRVPFPKVGEQLVLGEVCQVGVADFVVNKRCER